MNCPLMSHRCSPMIAWLLIAGWLAACGCGTTRLTDTARSASEEMLLSHSIDQSVGQLNLQVLAGQAVYLDTTNLGDVNCRGYLTGALRQHLLASGARLVCAPEQAEVVVEARAGSVATTRHETMVGVPETTVPSVFGFSGTIPELAIVKQAIHIGVTKVGVFAYRADSGMGIWQSGMRENQSISKSKWLLGTGPFQSGDVVLDGAGVLTRSRWRQPLPPRRSSLEFENWVGELPPERPWDAMLESEEAEERNGDAPIDVLPESIDPPPSEADPDKTWHWVRPVVVTPLMDD